MSQSDFLRAENQIFSFGGEEKLVFVNLDSPPKFDIENDDIDSKIFSFRADEKLGFVDWDSPPKFDVENDDAENEETAKYVETQVQTVGTSVKKFYAEVLQDLLPPSSLDPKNTEGSVLFLEQNAAFGTYEKPKTSVKEDPAKGDSSIDDTSDKTIPAVKSSCQEQNDKVDFRKKFKGENNSIKERLLPSKMSEGITPSGKNSRQASLCSRVYNKNHLLPSLSANPVIAVDSRLSMEQNINGEMCRKSHLPNETGPLKAKPPLAEVLKLVAPAGKGISRASSFDSLLEEDHAKAFDAQMKMNFPTSFILPIRESRRKFGTSCSNNSVVEVVRAADNSSASQPSPLVPPVVSCEIKVVENGLSTSNDRLTDSNVVETLATFATIHLKESSWKESEQFSEEKSDDDRSEQDDSDDIVELVSETINEFQSAKLEESCIFVDSKEVPFVPHQAGKRRSYKKKIRDALASRMRLAKNQEYEQLAIWHGDPDDPLRAESSSPSLLTKELKKSPSYDIGESEWELL